MKKIVLSILLISTIIIGSFVTIPITTAKAATCLHTVQTYVGNFEDSSYTYSATTSVCYFYYLYHVDKCSLCGAGFKTIDDTVIFYHVERETLESWDSNWYYFRVNCSTCGIVLRRFQMPKDPEDSPY
jgi:hypothetical protein